MSQSLALRSWFVVTDAKFGGNAAVGATSETQATKLIDLQREYPAPRYTIRMFTSEAAQLDFLKGPALSVPVSISVPGYSTGSSTSRGTYVLVAAGVALAAYLLWSRR